MAKNKVEISGVNTKNLIVLSKEKTVAIQAVIDEDQVFELVNDLRNAGAKDILVVPIERII